MKKTLLVLSTLIGGLSFAQQTEADQPYEQTGKPAAPAYSDAKAAPFWVEDFGNGFPADWAIIDTSGICPWTHSTDGSWGNFNGNNATAAGTAIASTTAANGFLICDADSANHFTYGQPSGSNYQYLSSYFATSGIDCSGHSSVILSFEQFYRYNNGVEMNVMVSSDSTNWTTYDVSGGLSNNTASANAALVNLNITNIAANQPNVYLVIGWSARVYYWQIDDIALSEADPNDIALDNSWWGTGTFQYQQYKIPLTQASPVTFYTEISNNTGSTLNDIYADVEVTNSSGSAALGSSATGSLVPVEMDTFELTGLWTPSSAELHDIDYTAQITGVTDGNLTNNTASDQIEITNSLYGMDNLQSPQDATGSISNFSSNTGNQFKIGNLYEIINDDGVQCIEVGIADDATNVGQAVYAEVYVWNPTTQEFDQRGYTDIYDLTAQDVGTIINLPLITGEAFYTAGEEMLVVAGHYGGDPSGDDDVTFMYGQPVADQMVWGFNAAGEALWLSSPRAIVARANFDCGLGVDELAEERLEVYPNPASSVLNIEFDGAFDLELVDIHGKVVTAQNGSQLSTELDITGIANGMYTLVVSTDAGKIYRKVMID